MACTSGPSHTITLSDEGFVYSFGKKNYNRIYIGRGNENYALLPTRVPDLPKIKQVACGKGFTVCVDVRGFLWSFGQNTSGQRGTGSIFYSDTPKKILSIPPVVSVSCGSHHSLIITNDSDLWSCGNNDWGQLCLGNKEFQFTFKQTSFTNISRISLGNNHSLFQTNEGEIYGCGSNINKQLGSACLSNTIAPFIISNLPSNIVQFVCGTLHNLFLDSEGNVFSFGENCFGQLGHGFNTINITDIPPIRTISCVGSSSYLIDYDGNLWSFGHNNNGQLGHGDSVNRKVPTKVERLKDIQQISFGCFGSHVLVKDSENTIFAMGHNANGQLGTGSLVSYFTPKEINFQYFPIWGKSKSNVNSRAKSARK